MRRMYSKEQLQKLIDEVSRLIAIEELDKVVPVPSLEKAGFIMQVNSAGTGYQLKDIDELQVPIYFHPIYLFRRNQADGVNINGQIDILNNDPTPFTSISQLIAHIRTWGLSSAKINFNGAIKNTDGVYIISTWEVYQDTDNLVGMLITDGSISGVTGLSAYTTGLEITDAVNKIN